MSTDSFCIGECHRGGRARCGADGGKGLGQTECGSAKHGPDAEPGSRVAGESSPTRSRKQEWNGESGGALPPQHRRRAGCVLRAEKNAAAGIDKETWADYAREREPRLRDLHARLHRRAYRALPSRRVMIPKPGDGERPLGIAAIEDKIVQMAVVMILTPIYEAEFLVFSYGFRIRPGRGAHDALDAYT